MEVNFPTFDQQSWMSLCDQDSEFKMASRHWSGGLRLIIGNQKLELFLEKGEIVSANYSPERVIEISGEADVWSRLKRYQKEGRRIIAVGTTVVRVLETLARQDEPKLTGTTQIFIYPPFQFKMIQGLVTNFHLPKSTLLMLVASLCGRKRLLSCYQEAVGGKYRFFSYGDCMLLI